jgi:hypothetical protein
LSTATHGRPTARPDPEDVDPDKEKEMDALRQLVEDGILTPEQERAVESALVDTAPRRVSWVAEVGGYLGGLLMLGGVGVILGNSWASMSRGLRVEVLAGFAVAFALAGVLAAGGPARLPRLARDGSGARRRVVGLLLGLAAIPTAGAVGVAVERYSGTWAGLVGLAVAVAGLTLVRTVAGLVVTVGASVTAMSAVALEIVHASELTTAVLIFGLGVAWLVLAALRWVPARHVALSLGAVIAFVGCAMAVDKPWTYALPLALGVACFVAYPVVRSIVLLVVGVLAVTDGTTQLVGVLTAGVLSQAVVLAVGGAALIAASLVGLGLRRGSPNRVGHASR